MIKLTRKTLKMDNKRKTHKQQFVEALACTWKHPSVIKFLAIHTKTMEAYTLWWNGETLGEMLDYNTKYSPIIDNFTLLWQSRLTMERWTWLVAFRRNCVKLAWAFINIINEVHHYGILHNNLSKNNNMLHLSIDKPDVMYIGVCNWGQTKRLQEVTPSLYGFAKEQDASNTRKMHW